MARVAAALEEKTLELRDLRGARGIDREVQCKAHMLTLAQHSNIANAVRHINEAVEGGARVVALPECWNCPYENKAFPVYCEEIPEVGDDSIDASSSPSINALSCAAREHRVWVVGGSVPETRGGKLYNTATVFSPSGELIAKYSKIHLFDIDIPGKMTFKESDTLTGGNHVACFNVGNLKIGVAICYDIRFPELFLVYARKHQCHVMLVPGAFNTTTGPRHWELLQRARAVDNQVRRSARDLGVFMKQMQRENA